MNKTVKGSLAGAAGIALLMGGFGSYALWSDDEALPASGVTAGTLDVTAGTATFKDQNNATWGASDLVVPGDTIIRSQSFAFTGSGNNLSGRIRFVAPTTSNGFGSDMTITVAATGVTGINGSGGCFDFTVPAGANQNIATTVTYAFKSTTAGQSSQSAVASVTGGRFYIEQGKSCSDPA